MVMQEKEMALNFFMNSKNAFRIAAIVGFVGVALGAFGAHGLKELLLKNQTADIWEKAVFYQMIHSVVLLFLSAQRSWKATPYLLFAAGIIVFSGSLYILVLTGQRWLGAITPVGGLCLLAGWLLLAFKPAPAEP